MTFTRYTDIGTRISEVTGQASHVDEFAWTCIIERMDSWLSLSLSLFLYLALGLSLWDR